MKIEEVERIYNINIAIMKHNQIISAIPRKWKRLLQTPLLTNVGSSDQIPYKCFSNIQKVKNSQIYKYFVTQKIITPVSQNKWVKYYPFLEHVDWEKIHAMFQNCKRRIYRLCSSRYYIEFIIAIIICLLRNKPNLEL